MYAVFSYFQTTGSEAYSFTTDGYGIFNVRTTVGACRTHEGESGTNKSAQELTWRDRKTALHPAPPVDQGSSNLNSDALTTELRPPIPATKFCPEQWLRFRRYCDVSWWWKDNPSDGIGWELIIPFSCVTGIVSKCSLCFCLFCIFLQIIVVGR